MRIRALSFLAFGVAAAVIAATVFVPSARSQIQVAPSYVPMGVAAGGAVSTAWFHERSSRRVMACQTVPGQGGALSAIQCVSTELP